MFNLRPAKQRGHFDFGWLQTYHSFSFGQYHDPKHMGWSSLRVINEDYIAPEGGFGKHGHRDMEIITVVLSGAVKHKDSMNNQVTIYPGQVQKMSAGTGIMHSEFNPSSEDQTHMLQIWIQPDQSGIKPGYEEFDYDYKNKLVVNNQPLLLGSNQRDQQGIYIQQDAKMHLLPLESGSIHFELDKTRRYWVQAMQGESKLNDLILKPGDGVAIDSETSLSVHSKGLARLLLFDLA